MEKMTQDRPKLEISVKGQAKWQSLHDRQPSHPFLLDSEALAISGFKHHLSPFERNLT